MRTLTANETQTIWVAIKAEDEYKVGGMDTYYLWDMSPLETGCHKVEMILPDWILGGVCSIQESTERLLRLEVGKKTYVQHVNGEIFHALWHNPWRTENSGQSGECPVSSPLVRGIERPPTDEVN